MDYQHFSATCPAPHVWLATLTRPEAANALNTRLAEEIAHFFSHLPHDARAVVLAGEGAHFCAGADLKERQGMDEAAWETQHAALRSARDAVWHCPVPTIAAVQGAARGGGFELALACDRVVAGERASFALPEASLGIMPGMGGVALLARAVGPSQAADMLFTARPVSAAEAFACGLAVKAASPDVVANALLIAQQMAANAPLALRAIKQALRQRPAWEDANPFAAELALYRTLIPTQDRKEGIRAFGEKRPPVFQGN